MWKNCQWLATGWWFSLGPPVSSTNKTDRHGIIEILLKVALNTIKPNLYNSMLTDIDSFNYNAKLLWKNVKTFWKLSSPPLESRNVSKENSITAQILSLLTDCLDQFLIIQSFLEVTGNLSSPTKKQSIWLAYLYIQTISNRGSFSEKLSAKHVW